MGTRSGKGGLRDLVVTAAVASVVSAIVGPRVQRWLEQREQEPEPEPEPPDRLSPDDFDDRIQRLLEGPEPFPGKALAEATPRRTRTETDK